MDKDEDKKDPKLMKRMGQKKARAAKLRAKAAVLKLKASKLEHKANQLKAKVKDYEDMAYRLDRSHEP
jgi:hypothetical protein